MDIKDIYEIMDKFEQSSIIELQLKINDIEMLCKKESKAHTSNRNTLIFNPEEEKNEEDSKKSSKEGSKEKCKEKSEKGYDVNPVFEMKAKVAGTFYRASSPESEPFVQVGQSISKGDIIGMIEAMKMMNEVISPVNGKIVEIIAKNEELVEFDSVLIKIEETK